MELNIQPREIGDVTVLDVSGRLVFGDEAKVLRERVKELLGQGKKRLLLNLQGVSFIDSSGAGTIVACFTSTRGAGGNLKLANANKYFYQVLQLTRLLGLLDVYASEEEALASFE